MAGSLVSGLEQLSGSVPGVLKTSTQNCLKKDEPVEMAESFLVEFLKASLKLKLEENQLLLICDRAKDCFDILSSSSSFSSALKINRVGYHFCIDCLGLNSRSNAITSKDLVKSISGFLDHFCTFLSRTLASGSNQAVKDFLKEYTSIVDNLSRLTWNFALVLNKSQKEIQDYVMEIFMSSFRFRCLSAKNDFKCLLNYCLPIYQHYENNFTVISSFFRDTFQELLTSCVQYKKYTQRTISLHGILEFIMSWVDLSFKQYQGMNSFICNILHCRTVFFELLQVELGSCSELCQTIWAILEMSIVFPDNATKPITDVVDYWVTVLHQEMGSPVSNDILLRLAAYVSKWFVLLSNILKDVSPADVKKYESMFCFKSLVEWAMEFLESNVTEACTTNAEFSVLLFRGYTHCFYYMVKDSAVQVPESILQQHMLFFQTHIHSEAFSLDKKILEVTGVLGNIALLLAEKSFLCVSPLLDCLIATIQDYVSVKGFQDCSQPSATEIIAKAYGRLALSYRHLGLHLCSLEALAKLMVHAQGAALEELLKRWLMLKRFIYNTPSQACLRKRSVVHQLQTMDHLLSDTEACSLLNAELRYYRTNGAGLEEELVSLTADRIRLSSVNDVHRAMAVVDHCRLVRLFKLKSEWNLERLCEEALKTLEGHTVSGYPSNPARGLYLSFGYYELYLQKSTQLKECIKASGVSRVKTTWTKPVPKGDEEPSTSCDIQASLRYVTLVSGTECLRPLEKSLSALQQSTKSASKLGDSFNWAKECVEPKLIANHSFALAESFLLSQRVEQSACSFVQLHRVGLFLRDQEVKCQAVCRLVSLLARAGLPSQALLLVPSMQSASPLLSIQCQLAMAEAHFYSGQFEKGFSLLLCVLNELQTAQDSSMPRWAFKALDVEAHFLLVRFYMLSTRSLSFLSERAAQVEKPLPKKVLSLLCQPPVVIALNALKLCIKLYKSEHTAQDVPGASWKVSAHKLCLERLLLEGGLLVGRVYTHQGELQEPRHILLDYLATAQEQAAMLWSADLLMSLAELDLLSHNPDDCKVKCQGLFYLLNKEEADPVVDIKESVASIDSPSIVGSPDRHAQDTLIYQELDDSPKQLVKGHDLFSSPLSSLHPKNRCDEIHMLKCLCERCRYVNVDVNLLCAMKLQAECLAYLGDFEACVKELMVLRSECDKIIAKTEFKLQRLREIAKKLAAPLSIDVRQFDFREMRDSTVDNKLLELTFNLNLSLAECLIQMNNPQQALFYLDQSLREMQTQNSCPAKLMPCIYAALVLHKCLARLHIQAQKRGCTLNSLFHCSSSNDIETPSNDFTALFHNLKVTETGNGSPLPSPYATTKTDALVLPNAPVKKGKGMVKKNTKASCIELQTSNSDNELTGVQKNSPDSESTLDVKGPSPSAKATVNNVLQQNVLKTLHSNDNIVGNISGSEDEQEQMPKTYTRISRKSTREPAKLKNIDSGSGVTKGNENCVNNRVLRNRDKSSPAVNFESLKQARALRQRRREQKENIKDECEVQRSCSTCSSPEVTRGGHKNAKPVRTSRRKLELAGVDRESECLRQMPVEEHATFRVTREPYRAPLGGANKHTVDGRGATPDDQASGEFTRDLKTVLEAVQSDLHEALSAVSHNPPSILYSNINVLLAMVQHALCAEKAPSDLMKVSYHLSQSVGITLRHQSLLHLHKRISARGDKTESARKLSSLKSSDEARLDVLSFRPLREDSICESMQKSLDWIPEDWTVVQVNGAKVLHSLENPWKEKTPDLMVTRYTSRFPPLVAMLSARDMQQCKGVLKEFEDIMETVAINGKEQQPKVWWTHRFNLDARIQNLCRSMETAWLGCWKCLFLGKPTNPEYAEHLQNALQVVLEKTKPLELHCKSEGMLKCLLDGLASGLLERKQVCSGLHYLFGLQSSIQQQKPLLDIIHSLGLEKFPSTERKPLVLILDKMVHQLPWENMPFLKRNPVSRMPSLDFLLSQLMLHSQDNADSVYVSGVDGLKTFYLLNPSKDLIRTETFFKDKFAIIPEWKGLTGDVPTKEQILSAVMDFDCYLYIGHGSGRVYLCREYVQSYPCRAAVILMGCSSAKLKAVGCFEPSGVVFHYLMGGCPAVLGNLWDVTDKDIDLFTEALIEKWLRGRAGAQLNLAVTEGRQVCRLKHLTGAAPIIYGLPLCNS